MVIVMGLDDKIKNAGEEAAGKSQGDHRAGDRQSQPGG
jgi:hypothetical protein